MTCNLDKKYIYIYKGDDTNWNNEQFLTVNVTSEAVDLSTMTAKFILGSYSQTFPLTEGNFKVDLTHAVTGTYAYGPINGVIQILDSEQRIKTVSNTIPFYITNKVIAAQDETYNVEVPEGSPIDISIDIGFGDVKWGIITGNINDQLDLKAALYSKVSKIGDTMTGDLVMDNAAVDFGEFQISADDGLAKIEGEQYGLRVDTSAGLGAALFTNRGLGEVLTTLDVKDTYSPTNTDPISGKGVAQAISTKQNTLTTAQLTAVNSGIDSAKVAQIATNAQNITNEATARENADNGLQTQIDALSAASDVKDIVGTYAELQAYDTSKLGNNDIIKVLTDETHDGAPSYYRWSTSTQTFTYIGSESAAYTKAQADAKFETQTDAAATYATQTALSTGLAGKASNADGTTIVDNGSTISTVAVKEQNNALAIKEWVGTREEYEALEEIDANTLYTITDDADSQAIVVDSTLSPTSTNPIQNKAVYDALQDLDALPSQTGHAGEYLTTDGTTASWGAVAGGGIQNESTNTGAIAIGGYNTTVGTNKGTQHSVIIGQSAQGRESSTSYPAVVVGYSATGNNGSVAVGRSANANRTSATYNTAVGARTDADNNGVAIGHYANAYTNAVAIGGNSSASNKTNANGDGAIAIGSKAVANGAGTIQIGTGTNSTAGTVQFGNYPILDANGKIPSDRLNMLITVWGFSSSNYVQDKNLIDFESGTSYDFWFHFRTRESGTALGFMYSSIDFESSTAGGFDIAHNSSGQLYISQSEQDYSGWAFDASLATISNATDYWLNMRWDGTTYTYVTALDKELTNIVNTATYTSSKPIKNSTKPARIGMQNRGNSPYWRGKIYLSDYVMKINNTIVFDGGRGSNYDIVGTPTFLAVPQ